MRRDEAELRCEAALDILEREIPRMWLELRPPTFWECLCIGARAFWRTLRGLPVEPADQSTPDLALLAAGTAILQAAGRNPFPPGMGRCPHA